ncbi:hypothetical protein GCM10019071_28870 [Sphingobium fuliginis]|uniref:Uncharacterized protein n=1 Tax=Sphingobium fuliginis (strain ATCC 27551) TaxID=336203 RepID=A0ABQ1F1T9_SPHSA|nr:hypothetical protein GCM10019071_28870 [Sphingobium fuliginis]
MLPGGTTAALAIIAPGACLCSTGAAWAVDDKEAAATMPTRESLNADGFAMNAPIPILLMPVSR